MIVAPDFRRRQKEKKPSPPVGSTLLRGTEVVVTADYGVFELVLDEAKLFGIPVYLTRDERLRGVALVSGEERMFVSDRELREMDVGALRSKIVSLQKNSGVLAKGERRRL